jgi:NADPH:quinone reductase-like Zn-dependent oxidoreductase
MPRNGPEQLYSSLEAVCTFLKPLSHEIKCTENFLVSGTGSIACQLAKNVFGAAKVITTVSTKKVPKVTELLGAGVVDQSENGGIPH